MLSDIEIAQQAKMLPIAKVAENLGIDSDDLEFYGKYKAKLSDELIAKCDGRKNGKLILVTAINPTPAGINMTGMISIRNFPTSFTASSLMIPLSNPINKITIP